MACIILWCSAVRVHDSLAYRKMDVTRERISNILGLRKILLSFQTSFNLVNAAVVCAVLETRSGELQMQKLKSHLMRTLSLNILSFKPGVGQYIAMHATLNASDFFLANFYLSGPFTCIFSKTSPEFFLC